MKQFIIQHTKAISKATCLLVVAILLITACSKNNAVPIFSGTYNGKFITPPEITALNAFGHTTIVFTDNKYSATSYIGGPAVDGIPVKTDGTFQLKNDSIIFINSTVLPTTTGTSQALTGTYQFHFEGDSLIITQNYSQNSINQYRLKRN